MGVILNLVKVFMSCYLVTTVRAAIYHARVGGDHVNVVSEKFLSFTVDPKYLFSSNEKYGSRQECICMAASLSPAYLRIAGPSTAHMTFHNSTIAIDSLDKDNRLRTISLSEKKEKGEYTSEFQKQAKKFRSGKVLKRNRRQIKDISQGTDLGNPYLDLGDKSGKIFETILRIRRQKKLQFDKVQVTSDEWKRFSVWAKATGFEIIFALNNEEKATSGLWDPNMALDILSVAEKEAVENIVWQLGYECTNQSIDEYLNDLETLRVIVDTIPLARLRGWRVAGSDVTGCLREDSRSDFKDYVTLSLDMADALMLNGNSSSHELERLSPIERSKLLTLVHESAVPLWVTERTKDSDELELSDLERAAAWMASLGHSARRGAKVHFRELTTRELYQPTLSFYMALFFKNLVGERVLDVEMESSTTVLFAHCTSLRRQSVPGALTLYGANMDDEPARLSLKLSKREEGGDIMQFILSEDEKGNIIVNGNPMSREGDIRPVVRRVRPYKTLLINLPAKSFGFWVVANTKIDSCQYLPEKDDDNLVKAEPVDEIDGEDSNQPIRIKRAISKKGNDINVFAEVPHLDQYDIVETGNKELDNILKNLNNNLREMHNILNNRHFARAKRQTSDGGQRGRKPKRQLLKTRPVLMKIDEEKPFLSFVGDLLRLARNGTRHVSHNMLRNSLHKLHRTKIGIRHSKKATLDAKDAEKRPNVYKLETLEQVTGSRKNSRTRRSVDSTNDNSHDENIKSEQENEMKLEVALAKDDENISKSEDFVSNSEKTEDLSEDNSLTENEVEVDVNDNKKLWKVLHNIQSQLKRISENNNQVEQNTKDLKTNEADKIVVNTEITDDGATVNFKEEPNVGWVKSTFENLFHVLNNVNENLNRFWEALSFFE